jgi:hypothetical protein
MAVRLLALYSGRPLHPEILWYSFLLEAKKTPGANLREFQHKRLRTGSKENI